jgi:hypothetical protein
MGIALPGFVSRSAVLGIVLVATGGLYTLSFAALVLKNGIDWPQILSEAIALLIFTVPGIIPLIEGLVLLHRHRARINDLMAAERKTPSAKPGFAI